MSCYNIFVSKNSTGYDVPKEQKALVLDGDKIRNPTYNDWSLERQALIVTMYVLCGENPNRTKRALRKEYGIDTTEKQLRRFIRKNIPLLEEFRKTVVKELKDSIASKCISGASKALDRLQKAIDHDEIPPEKLPYVISVLIDKAQLLTGGPTTINEQVYSPFDAVLEKLQIVQGKAAQGEVVRMKVTNGKSK